MCVQKLCILQNGNLGSFSIENIDPCLLTGKIFEDVGLLCSTWLLRELFRPFKSHLFKLDVQAGEATYFKLLHM